MIQIVEWDSLHFNMNVGFYNVPTQSNNFNFEALQQEAKACHYDVVYVRSKSPIIEIDNKQTFRNERIVYVKYNTEFPPYGLKNRIKTVSASGHVRIKKLQKN